VKVNHFRVLTISALFTGAPLVPLSADPPAEMGSGNVGDEGPTTFLPKFSALNSAGVKVFRYNLYPGDYFRNGAPYTLSAENELLAAQQHAVTPMILFEHYGPKDGAAGSYKKWYDIGRAFALRFMPNGTFWQSQGISDFGISLYSAFNEPDADSGTGAIPTAAYAVAMEGLADGVNSADAALKVIPGGYARPNSSDNYTANGFISAIAPLLNSGKLDGIDLHTYNGPVDARIYGSNGVGIYTNSAQHDFARVKTASGITADINFYTTEFNFKKQNITEDAAAKGFLTCLWDNLGVVKNNGTTRATKLVFPYLLLKTSAQTSYFSLSTQLSPWVPTRRGEVLQLVVNLTQNLSWGSLAPKTTGEFVLFNGNGTKLWVWQNRTNWTNRPGTSFGITGIPGGTGKIEVYGWDGLRNTIPMNGQASYTVTDLPTEETLMFRALQSAAPNVSIAPPLNGSTVSRVGFTIKATASDTDGTIKRVEFYDGATKIGEDTAAPYSYTWAGAPLGARALKARAVDNTNKTRISASVNVTVN